MAKRIQKTRVIINDRDVSDFVADANLPRVPGQYHLVQLEMFVDRLEVGDDGTLIIHINTAEEA